MRRLSIFIVLAAVMAVGSAWASYRATMTVSGAPVDVEIRDAGSFTLATNDPSGLPGAYEMVVAPDGATTTARTSNTPAGDTIISAFVEPASGCLNAITSQGYLLVCPPMAGLPSAGAQLLPQSTGVALAQVRHTSAGSAYARGKDATNTVLALHFASWGADAGLADVLPTPPNDLVAVGSLRADGGDYGLFGMSPAGPEARAFFAVNGTKVSADFATGLQSIDEVQLFSGPNGIEGLIGGVGGMVVATLHADGSVGVAPVQGVAGYRITGLAFDYGSGNELGDGFGLAVGIQGATTQVFSAVPDPKAPGRTWAPNTVPTLGTPQKVRCFNGSTCVLYNDGTGSNNVSVYSNQNKPAFTPAPSPFINEGDVTPATLKLQPQGDSDGDAVYYTWSKDVGSPLELIPDGGKTTIGVRVPGAIQDLCGKSSASYNVTATASDGLPAHVISASTIVTVIHNAPPAVPVVYSLPASVRAGPDAGFFLSAGPGPGEVCLPGQLSFGWKKNPMDVTGTGFVVVDGGVRITPPAFWCYPANPIQINVTASDGKFTSAPAPLTVQLEPWGPPDVKPFAITTATQLAGTDASYPAAGRHVCDDSPDFPGVDTVWQLATDAGVHFRADGGEVSSGVTAGSIEIVAPRCVSGTATLKATPYTRGDERPGPEATLVVNIQRVLVPLGSAGIALDGGFNPADGGVLTGTVSTAANCGQLRGLRAELALYGPGGVKLDEQHPPLDTEPALAPWTFQLPPSICSGGLFKVTAQIKDATTTGAATELSTLIAPRPAGISDVTVGQAPVARCGDDGVVRAAAELRAELGPDSCTTAAITWEQLSGPQVAGTLSGKVITVEAQGASFDALVAQPLRFRVTADAGGGNAASVETDSVPVTIEQFIHAPHEPHPPVVSESGLLGIKVRVANDTACGVSGAEYREELDGLRYVQGSAKVDGEPVDAVERGGMLVLSGLDLPSRGARTLTYSARPRLLGTARPVGQAFLNELPISEREGFAPLKSSGCGCSGGGGAGLPALGLAMAGMLLRRGARRKAARSPATARR